MLRHFEEGIRTSPKVHALIAIPYTRTELQHRLAWCMFGLTGVRLRRKEKTERRKGLSDDRYEGFNDSRSSGFDVCEEWRRSYARFMLEQLSMPAFNTCVNIMKEGDKKAKALVLLDILDIYQSKPMRVTMKEPVVFNR